jgi:hypothetical protein
MDPRINMIVYVVAAAASVAYGMKLMIILGLWLRRILG